MRTVSSVLSDAYVMCTSLHQGVKCACPQCLGFGFPGAPLLFFSLESESLNPSLSRQKLFYFNWVCLFPPIKERKGLDCILSVSVLTLCDRLFRNEMVTSWKQWTAKQTLHTRKRTKCHHLLAILPKSNFFKVCTETDFKRNLLCV